MILVKLVLSSKSRNHNLFENPFCYVAFQICFFSPFLSFNNEKLRYKCHAERIALTTIIMFNDHEERKLNTNKVYINTNKNK